MDEIISACLNGDLERLKLLLCKNKINDYSTKLLNIAIEEDYIDIVEYLVEEIFKNKLVDKQFLLKSIESNNRNIFYYLLKFYNFN